MNAGRRISFFFSKIYRFEFWPFWLFYIPMYFYGIYLALRARSPMYFSTTNPGMKYGGVMGVSKFQVLSSIPKKYVPRTIFISTSTPFGRILEMIQENKISYPLIIKPDIGERGKDVEKIDTETELKNYLSNKHHDLNIQEFIHHDQEYGIMYHRIPGDERGSITSVVQKGFLSVTGDGRSSLEELLEKEIRAAGRLDYLRNKYKDQLSSILIKGEKMYLEPIGNHCRGTIFHNVNHLINEQMTTFFDGIAHQIDGYFYGRFDLKVPNVKSLYSGKEMKIIELNGVSSEVAHVYDPDYKLLNAYRDIKKHMYFIYLISKKNFQKGIKRDSLSPFLRDLRNHFRSR